MVRRSVVDLYALGIHPVALRAPGQVLTGEIEELWLMIASSSPEATHSVTSLVGLMNELGEQGWEPVTYAQPFTGYHGGCYTFKRQK